MGCDYSASYEPRSTHFDEMGEEGSRDRRIHGVDLLLRGSFHA